MDMRHVLFWGKVCLAEQMPTPRAVRRQTLCMDRPDFEDVVVERSLYSFKVYKDIAMDMDYFVFSHGPCWEPVISQVTLALNYLTGIWRKATECLKLDQAVCHLLANYL